jgi:hypothetical protein
MSHLPRLNLQIIATWLTFAAFMWPSKAAAHQFEDGYIERAVAVRIRDRDVRIEYSIGLNDATIKKFIEHWPNDQKLYQQFHDELSKKTVSSATHKEENAATAETPIILPEEGSLVNEIQLIRAFAKLAAPQLKAGLRVMVNKEPIALKLVSAEPSSKHHATLETIWRFQLPPDSMAKMSIQDTNFLKQPGGIKYSLKTSGTSMTIQSNVAPILVRSTRTGLDSLSVTQRLLVPGIEAKIRVLPVTKAER